MKNYEPASSFGRTVAEADEQRGDEEAAATFLAQRAGSGPALELAIGTGRIALPLAARGVRVDGIDISPAMVERLRSKPGGDQLSVTAGDFADVGVPGSYALIYIVWNSLFNLLTQEDQLRCFQNVAKHLTPGGSFVIEAYVPSFLHRLRNDQYVEAESIEVDEVRLDVLRHDAAKQTLEESHVSLSRTGIRLVPVVQRYAWPSELDLMARAAGLALVDRFGGWGEEPYDSVSPAHVSVYGSAS
jgi:SAM-dependent methyltransferase